MSRNLDELVGGWREKQLDEYLQQRRDRENVVHCKLCGCRIDADHYDGVCQMCYTEECAGGFNYE